MATITSDQLLDFLYTQKLPQVYRDMDSSLLTLPLKRYLSALIEGGFEDAIKDTDNLLSLLDPETCPDEFVPYLCQSFGLDYSEDIDVVYQRRLLLNIGEIVRRRGTYSCVRFLSRALTGLEVDLTYQRGYNEDTKGRYLFVTLLANSIDEVNNLDTSVFVMQRYISSQIPFYIIPQVNTEVATQILQNDTYYGGAVQSSIQYQVGG